MKLEFHQLNRRYEHLRARNRDRQRRLMTSLAASGQQTPIVVIAVSKGPDRYLVIDGYKRVEALEQLGRDTVEAATPTYVAARFFAAHRRFIRSDNFFLPAGGQSASCWRWLGRSWLDLCAFSKTNLLLDDRRFPCRSADVPLPAPSLQVQVVAFDLA